MNTWQIIDSIAPYVILACGIIAYFFKKDDRRKTEDHELLIKINSAVESIKLELQDNKEHLSSIDIDREVHERWINKVCAAIMNIRIYHDGQHKEKMDLDLQRPEPLKL